jgi:hypothetical protein
MIDEAFLALMILPASEATKTVHQSYDKDERCVNRINRSMYSEIRSPNTRNAWTGVIRIRVTLFDKMRAFFGHVVILLLSSLSTLHKKKMVHGCSRYITRPIPPKKSPHLPHQIHLFRQLSCPKTTLCQLSPPPPYELDPLRVEDVLWQTVIALTRTHSLGGSPRNRKTSMYLTNPTCQILTTVRFI